jgi:hypothetical protein
MAVVINEFEVITDAPRPTQQPGAQQPAQGQSQASGITPYAVERVLRHQKGRIARIRAH